MYVALRWVQQSKGALSHFPAIEVHRDPYIRVVALLLQGPFTRKLSLRLAADAAVCSSVEAGWRVTL